MKPAPLPQDLHIHTTWSDTDSSIVPEQTIELIAALGHARICGISDHFEMIVDQFDDYRAAVAAQGLLIGTEVNGHEWVPLALDADCDYRIFHIWSAPRCKSHLTVQQKETLRPYIRRRDEVA
ncbi:PHP domain-containing protein [Lamprobacter modestohalophilus]|nr:PHP domain-containing protein [Lamprobacter modestohalophilus]